MEWVAQAGSQLILESSGIAFAWQCPGVINVLCDFWWFSNFLLWCCMGRQVVSGVFFLKKKKHIPHYTGWHEFTDDKLFSLVSIQIRLPLKLGGSNLVVNCFSRAVQTEWTVSQSSPWSQPINTWAQWVVSYTNTGLYGRVVQRWMWLPEELCTLRVLLLYFIDSYIYRASQLEQFHSRLIDELESFERDSQALKNVEKEFSVFVIMEA